MRNFGTLLPITLAALFLLSCSPEQQSASTTTPATFLAVSTLSNQAHLISGGDALLEITSDVASRDELVITVNDELVSVEVSEYAQEDGIRQYLALLNGLEEGKNLVRVEAGQAAAAITLVN